MKVEFVSQNKTLSVNSGSNLRQLARKNCISVYRGLRKVANCHGLGMCGTCVVEISEGMENLSPATRAEEKLLAKQGLSTETHRLSCQTKVHGDVKVKTLE